MNIDLIAKTIKDKIGTPDIAIILGSGLGGLSDEIDDKIIIEYKDLPDFPKSNVEGHKGRFVSGVLSGKKVLCQDGRLHYYEGHDIKNVVVPIRVFGFLGIKNLIISNASGGVNKDFNAGDLMIIRDHINFTGINPLIGPNDERFGVRFPDMGEAYSRELITIAKKAAENLSIPYKEGVYTFLTGPSYETPAEVRAIRVMGGDAVGMSTVPEVIVANHQGMKVLGISSISNLAADLSNEEITHEMVLKIADSVTIKFIPWIKEIIRLV